jgi:hypothetical protein
MRILVALIVSTVGFGPAFAAPQPLTRTDCQKAGMHWNDKANVCGGGSSAANSAKMGKGEGTQTAPAKTPSEAHTQKIEQPHRKNPTTGN